MVHENKIEQIMAQKEISDDQICEITGLTRMTLWNAKQGKNVTLETMKLIAGALNESIVTIWPEQKEQDEAA